MAPTTEVTTAPYPPRLLWALRLVAVGLAAVNAAAGAFREAMNADGMSYLDMGEAFLRGDWSMAINGTWSPLYSWILGVALRVFEPSIRWEFPMVHIINFGLFLVALVAFEFFWRQVTTLYYRDAEADGAEAPARLPIWAWLSVGYLLFVWTSVALIEIYSVTPDMLVAASVFAASGFVLRIGAGHTTRKTMLLFGLVLGVGYLVKAALFPLAFIFLAVAVLVQGRPTQYALRTAPALLVFAVIAAPFVTALSIRSGHLAFSEIGPLTYLKHVREVPFPHWRPGVVEVDGAPEDPVRTLSEHPTIYEFATPVGGTYPLSYNPYHWYRGLVPSVHIGRQIRALAINLRFYFDLFVRMQGLFLGIVLVLTLLALGERRPRLSDGGWPLAFVALAALGMYAIVHVTYRYIAPFVVLFWTAILLSVRVRGGPHVRRTLALGGGALVAALAINIGSFHLEGLNALTGYMPSGGGLVGSGQVHTASSRPSTVAARLIDLDLDAGDRIGFIGYSFDAFWARLARLKIVAEIAPEEADAFWQADPARQRELLQIFADLGVRGVVAGTVPTGPVPPGWTPVGRTGFYVYLFSRETRSTHSAE